MQFVEQIFRVTVLVVMLGGLIACTTTDSLLPDRRPDYRQSRTISSLEIPPDLTASTIDDSLMVPEFDPTGSARLSDYTGERTGGTRLAAASEAVLQDQAGVRLERHGNQRWLQVDAEAGEVWPKIKAFWEANGIPLEREDPRIGVMETEWVENRADIPGGPIRNLLGMVMDFAYSAPTRDKFRIRLERVPEGTEVYLTHYGVEEVTRRDYGDRVVWQSRPSDPELEAEMLNRLMVHLGASQRRAEAQLARAEAETEMAPRVSRTRWVRLTDGSEALMVGEEYSRAWRLVGLALDGSNFVVEDQNRAQGLYVVEYRELLEEEERGILSTLAFWKDRPSPEGTRYQVRLGAHGQETLVMIHTEEGRPDRSPAARQILETLQGVIDVRS